MSDKIREKIELIFEQYRKHKYYTLFKDEINASVTSTIDEVGGGRSNKISDKTADAAIELVDELREAHDYVNKVELAVNQLPDVEQELIQERYMKRNYDYISDYTVYMTKLFISKPTYIKVRERAFERLFKMLV